MEPIGPCGELDMTDTGQPSRQCEELRTSFSGSGKTAVELRQGGNMVSMVTDPVVAGGGGLSRAKNG